MLSRFSRTTRSSFYSTLFRCSSTSNQTISIQTKESDTPPHAPVTEKPSPLLNDIVEKIAGLSLSQTAELVSLIKKRLNLTDMVMPMMGGGMPAPSQAAAEEAPKQEERKLYNVTLSKFDASSKAKVIKEIKSLIPNMNLIEAKKFVEGAPKVVKEGLTKDEAEKLKSVLETAGATVLLE
ncbi:hypothetical protein HMI54_005514 [Coelomomyces lativittatus]|nr:hypothetical protein HMI54_005514 [Coelomomyces lativittatus]KAJ1512380.1 hypothetical protein HMI56_004136 [Coelomomyces lativittatus]KAJ1517778.1 hypothetical protein HMI55_006019 [Coelomomyces lativittatus]